MRNVMWAFETKEWAVEALVEVDPYYRYDGDDEDGETQAKLDNGEYTAFDTLIRVVHKPTGLVMGQDSLGGSVYSEPEDFFTEHRNPDPMNRNCSLMREKRGRIVICQYFPDMVRQAVREARQTMRKLGSHGKLRH